MPTIKTNIGPEWTQVGSGTQSGVVVSWDAPVALEAATTKYPTPPTSAGHRIRNKDITRQDIGEGYLWVRTAPGQIPKNISALVTTSAAAPGAKGYDPDDDMLKVKSLQKKWRDSFTKPLGDNWDIVASGGSTAVNSAGVLTLSSGSNAGAFIEMLSKETFTIPFRAMFGVQNTRSVSNHHILEAVSVDPDTGIPDGRHSIQWDIGGAASSNAGQAIYCVQNGGLMPLASSAASISGTSAYSIMELEPFADEAYFHSRQLDSTLGRTQSYVRQQQIPDPTAVYKLRIRSMNHQWWKPVTGAVAGAGGVIRLTVAAHGLTTGNVVWAETLNGVLNGTQEVRRNYTVTVIDANTIDLQGTTFAGAYVAGSGRIALAAAPTAVTMQLQFASCQDYAELTAEITAGRGQTAQGQGVGVVVTNQIALSGAANKVGSFFSAFPEQIVDVASAAITSNTTTATITPTYGSTYQVNIPVTAVAGTNPTMDVVIQESDDGGINWYDVYSFPRITAAGVYRSPTIHFTGNRLRYTQVFGGTGPSFTRSINRLQGSHPVDLIRQIFNRTVNVTTLNSATASLMMGNARNAQMLISLGAATTVPAIQLEGSDDGGVSWYAIGAPLNGVANASAQLTVNSVHAGQIRARVSTAGASVTFNHILLKAF